METQYVERIYLIGPTGSGKTSVGAALAARLGWRFVDTDARVTERAGMSIPEIFARDGERHFRALESAALRDAAELRRVVIATGAGIVEAPENRALMRASGWVVALRCAPATALARLRAEAEAAGVALGALRPLLAGDEAEARVRALHERRAAHYAQCDVAMETEAPPACHPERHPAERVAGSIVATLVTRGLLAPGGAEEQVRHIRTSAGDGYDAVVAWGGLRSLSSRLERLGLARRVFLVLDEHVARLYGDWLAQALGPREGRGAVYRVPAGEGSKSREQLHALYDWLAEQRAERTDTVVAVGGGVVGDLAGFAAATYLRGMPLTQVPTSLLAQVDASIGGKTGINHPAGKNLIGAFYPPRLVLADPAVLLTLPPRHLTEGWAEVIKHGVALDAAYFTFLEEQADALLRKEPEALTRVVAGSVAIKAGVVERDEHEAGERALLNYGHTLGHAIEAVTGYGAWLHGEAVAVGLAFAARLGHQLGITPAEVVERQEALLRRFGLPTRAEGLSAPALLRAALWDKKVRGGRVRWVLPTALGAAGLVADVPDDDVRAVLREIGAVDDEQPPPAQA